MQDCTNVLKVFSSLEISLQGGEDLIYLMNEVKIRYFIT